jgi:hypothetical protein
VDLIITNPPFSQLRAFLKHSYEIANNVVFLAFTADVLGMKARLQDMNTPNGPLKSCCVYQHHPNLGRSQVSGVCGSFEKRLARHEGDFHHYPTRPVDQM